MGEPDKPPGSLTPSLVEGRRPYDTVDGVNAIGGKYEVDAVLGRGSMGVVMRAHDPALDRQVAIKVIRPDVMSTPGVFEAFAREAKAMAKARHPNVVKVYEQGKFEGTAYFVMEYIEGTDLEAWLASEGPRLSLDRALGVLDPLCRGVQAIHDAGALHRDLKPGNVFVGPAFRIAVGDFGLAAFVDDPELRAQLSGGTPEYMAPEVAAGQFLEGELAIRADVYGLAMMAYEILVGRLPYVHEDPREVMRMQVQEALPRPTSLRPGLPDEFDELLLRALAKDPKQRTASAEALRQDLHRAERSASGRLDLQRDSLRILVVDDDADQVEWMAVVLAARFPASTIQRASNGVEAFAIAKAEMPDLVITDLDMPGLNGLELTRGIRASEQGAEVPIVIVTGVGGALDWAELKALGANGFMVKPLEADAFSVLVANTVA